MDLHLQELPTSGVYAIVLKAPSNLSLNIGSLGAVSLIEGLYIYIGSALKKRLRQRIARHLSSFKKLRWHIDYLLTHNNVKMEGVIASETYEKFECKLVVKLYNKGFIPFINGFGSSDCKCISHLLRSSRKLEDTFLLIEEALKELGLKPTKFLLKLKLS